MRLDLFWCKRLFIRCLGVGLLIPLRGFFCRNENSWTSTDILVGVGIGFGSKLLLGSY